MAISFKYKAMKRPNGSLVKSPVIPVVLSGKSLINPEVIALIDSGADISVIPEDLAKLIGLNMDTKEETSSGIGGEVKVKSSKMNITITKGHENYQFDIPVQILISNNKIPVLLGRAGFFDKFKITFNQSCFIVSLKANTDKSIF